MSTEEAARIFDPLRPGMLRLAYRMLSSVPDAEDMVQETFLRKKRNERDIVRDPEAFLRKTIVRLCLDHLKSARHWRETYIGPWLPDPFIERSENDEVEDVTLPLMIALERLSPLERAAFLLHDVFGVSFNEISQTIGREEQTCRQLASRARTNVRAARPRFRVSKERGMEIAAAFFRATRNGDLNELQSLLAADVTVYADGGGKTTAPMRPISGRDNVLKLHASLRILFKRHMSKIVQYEFINSLPGFITLEEEDLVQTTALQIEHDKICEVYVTRNPEKLRHLHTYLKQ